MGERKVVNKYYPPDFDPSKIVRRRRQQQTTVRMMLPMTIRCVTCGNYNYKGTKFNSKKEDVGTTYLGIRIWRFYFKCTKCSAENIFKTDPKNSGYVIENCCQDEKKDSVVAECDDVMKSLENKALISKRQMDDDAALDELKSMKSRLATVTIDAMLEALQRSDDDHGNMEELEDEALVRSIFQGNRIVKRILELDDDDENNYSSLIKRRKVSDSLNNQDNKTPSSDCTKFTFKSLPVKVSVVKKAPNSKKIEQGNKTGNGLQWLCQQYESEED